jgi:predicted DNA-binding WGR domain protein
MQNSPLSPALPIRLHLQAIDPARNIARDYRIDVSFDLFGHWIIDLHWGRIGCRGQARSVSFAERRVAQRFVLAVLKKRQSAKHRIGVAYRQVSYSASAVCRDQGHSPCAQVDPQRFIG